MKADTLTLLCIRHGQTDWNLEGRYCGQTDVELNDTGRCGAETLAEDLRSERIDAVYSSDLIRAISTAEPLVRSRDIEIQHDKRLREIHQGVWEGMLFPDIKKKYAERFAERAQDPISIAPPGGETVGEVKNRVTSALQDIINRHEAGSRIAIVAHGFTLAIARVHFGNIDIRKVWDYIPPNTEVIEIKVQKHDTA